MRLLIAPLVLALAACGPNKADVVRDICVPNNENEEFDLEKAAKEKGYDIADVQSICRDWFQNELSEFNDKMQEMTGGESDPYAKAD
ncbi:hypothetical protein [Sphingorhabdus sp.]|uniref:hypothetical protein n=1 Tax=Sphingorhabdus sp. TaxID=1902408 RepID=UPI0035AF45EA